MEDFDLDTSDRFTRRIAHGVYRILHNRRVVGEELWGIFGLCGGGYRLMTEIDLIWPIRNQQRAHLDLDHTWSARKFWVKLDLEGKRRVAHYTPSGNELEIIIDEEPLRFGDPNRAPREQSSTPAVTTKARCLYASKVAYGSHTFLDYGSALLNFAHLRRLPLKPGAQVQIEAIVVTQPSLEPLVLSQTYCYVRDEQITSLVQPFMVTRRYTIEEHVAGGGNNDAPFTTIWTDLHDVVIKQEVLLGKETHGCELVSYQWLGEED
ncbi:MAG: hypothetical protein KatS3mg052_2556 [Candidatus Roseilinea sp.]|nr:MAG: hypothetical protein KatS3mg052_2556 [Candidatus Roseilinea sp.]